MTTANIFGIAFARGKGHTIEDVEPYLTIDMKKPFDSSASIFEASIQKGRKITFPTQTTTDIPLIKPSESRKIITGNISDKTTPQGMSNQEKINYLRSIEIDRSRVNSGRSSEGSYNRQQIVEILLSLGNDFRQASKKIAVAALIAELDKLGF